jgi:hypothetical protein
MNGNLAARRRMLYGALVIAVASAALGWVAASQISSPAQVAATTAPPPPSVITAAVERRVLSSQVVTRGSVVSTRTLDIGPAAVGAGVLAAVVTDMPVRRGQLVRSGQVVLEVSGRPVFLLAGDLPAYRDLGPGDKGPDVIQLQHALAVAGYAAGTPDGVYGPATAQAVRRLHERDGYDASPRLPASEVVYAPDGDTRVQAVNAQLGDPVAPDSVVLSTGEPTIVAQLNPTQVGLVRAGLHVEIYSEVLDKRLTGTVESLTSKPPLPAEQVVSGDRYALIRPGRGDARSFLGQDVRVTLVASSSHGKVLVVPVSAIVTTADGHTSVVVDADGGQRTVDVTVGITSEGLAQVTPQGGGSLAAGSRVVVGSQ